MYVEVIKNGWIKKDVLKKPPRSGLTSPAKITVNLKY